MKISCCSRSYARALQSGALTQLEWIDRCAELAFDGVDFAASHFPRSDDDYLAQLKKLCADRGLTVTCVTSDAPFGAGDVDANVDQLGASIDMALALGAPLVRFACGSVSGSPGIAWRELIRGLKYVSARAKDRNVTLALAPAAGTLVASPSDVKRAFKECDSAWLRLAPALSVCADPSGEWAGVLSEAVIAVSDERSPEGAYQTARSAGFIAFATLESSGPDEDAAVRSVLASLAATPAAPRAS